MFSDTAGALLRLTTAILDLAYRLITVISPGIIQGTTRFSLTVSLFSSVLLFPPRIYLVILVYPLPPSLTSVKNTYSNSLSLSLISHNGDGR